MNPLKPILEKKEHQEMQADRTRHGVCARCAESAEDHENGQCPDGKGSFTWCHSREDTRQMIRQLEWFRDLLKDNAAKPPMTLATVTDADRVCGIIYTASTGKMPTWASAESEFLAALSAASEQAVDENAARELLKKLIEVGPRILPNLNVPRVIEDLCGWSHARTMIAIEAARDAGYIRGGQELAKS
jgi:hypothetical protein